MEKNKEKIVIRGPSRLEGEISISGSKNAVLPMLAATLLTDQECVIKNVPRLSDIHTMINLLEVMGKKVKREKSTVTIGADGSLKNEAPYDLVKKLRASVLVMGGLVGRVKNINVALPGGCAIGARPIDIHLKGFRKMGVKTRVEGGFVNLSSEILEGTKVCLDFPSVGATENLIMAACLARGTTVLENTAAEPEVEQLIEFLKSMGARITTSGNIVKIEGCSQLNGTTFRVMDDRIQAGTYLIAGLINRSQIKFKFSHPETLEAVIDKAEECGAKISVEKGEIKVEAPRKLKSADIRTSPYPGFPTDLQAPFTTVMTVAGGTSVISEEIFESRMMHCSELLRMGADIEVKKQSAIVSGVDKLSGAPVTAADLRGGAALVMAGLIAEGRSEVEDIYHIERGYEDIVGKFSKLGADIWKE
ncbi:MAG: UDP-N-acetylglucosamine 1-carboxyvinyltransferase [Elusimicrobiota bacterium]